jgi:hypothetical protein
MAGYIEKANPPPGSFASKFFWCLVDTLLTLVAESFKKRYLVLWQYRAQARVAATHQSSSSQKLPV